jgi:hypothetical protein
MLLEVSKATRIHILDCTAANISGVIRLICLDNLGPEDAELRGIRE